MSSQRHRIMSCQVGFGLIALCVSVLFLPSSAEAQRTCRATYAPPSIELVERFGPVRYNNSRSRRELEQLRRSARSESVAGGGWFTVGLTRRGLKRLMEIRVAGLPDGRGSFCTVLASARLTLSYDSIDVFIARRYRPGTCEYESVLDHENDHVANFTSTLYRFLPKIRRQLEIEATRLPGILSISPQAAAEQLQRDLMRRLEGQFREMNRQMNAADARLDSPRSYRANQLRCDNW